jgi:hypothetical protein
MIFQTAGAVVSDAGASLVKIDLVSHQPLRTFKSGWHRFLTIAGPLLACVGLGFALIGFVEFVSTLGIFKPLRLTWCWAVGMPLLIAGIVLCDRTGHLARPGSDS